jgi:hypothetical protein
VERERIRLGFGIGTCAPAMHAPAAISCRETYVRVASKIVCGGEVILEVHSTALVQPK